MRSHAGTASSSMIATLSTLVCFCFAFGSADARSARVGNLWDQFGRSGEEGWGGTTMVWPGGFWKQDLGGESFAKASCSYKGFLYGFQNFTVPDDDASWIMLPDESPGTVLPYYVVQRDIKNSPGINGLQLIPGTVELTYRSNPATVTTDGVVNNPPDNYDLPEDESLPADVRIISKWRNNAGVQTTRTVYAFAHADHDDYHIWHYNFANTGDYCCGQGLDPTANPGAQFDQTLHNFHFSHSFWFMDRAEGGRRTDQGGEHKGDNLNNYKGHNPVTHLPEAVVSDTKEIVGALYGVNLGTGSNYGDLRVQYAWDGDGPDHPGEDSGDPDTTSGRMMSPRWPGVALIHADTAYENGADDPDQPKRSDYDNHSRMPQLLESEGPDYEFLYKTMTPDGPLVDGGLNNRFQQDAIREGAPYAADATNVKFRGSETILSVGDWELPHGEDINVIWVSAVGGIPYQETVELGKRLRYSDSELAAEDLTRLTETGRLAKYFSLEDSLFTVLRRAQNTITRDVSTLGELDARLTTQDVQSPPNAATFTVNSSADRIELTWTAPSTRADEVAKYRVYRARESRVGDFPWSVVYEGGATSHTDLEYGDGVAYFYYLVTVNSAGIESSPHMARTEHGVTIASPSLIAESVRPSASRLLQNAPNPFNPSTTVRYVVPAASQVRLDVYDSSGRLVRTLTNEIADAGTHTAMWDGLDDALRPVASGTYFCRLVTPEHVAIVRMTLVR